MKKITKKQLKKLEKQELSRRWKETRQQVLERDKSCIFCGATEKLNGAHVLGKEFKIFRHLQFDIRNIYAACSKDHKFGEFSMHRNPLYALEVIRVKYPDNYKFLLSEAFRLHENKKK